MSPPKNEKFHFIARMPDEPGALHKAAKIIKRYNANINRIHYDQTIDPHTVFFEVMASDDIYRKIAQGLQGIGYLQTSLSPPGFLKLDVYLPHRPGALFEFLNYISSSNANIAFLDFDDRGKQAERLGVDLTLEESSVVDGLLNQLKSRYRLEILEYNTTGEHLDNTVFYLRFAQRLRQITGEGGDEFILRLLHDINHIVQELTNLGQEPKQVFKSILLTGEILRQTSGKQFYADVQRIRVTGETELFCFQLPCGGNIFMFNTPGEMVMIDTGFGIYHQDVLDMLKHYGLGDLKKLRRIFVTHADADHAGAAGYFDADTFIHKGANEAIEKANRAYGSQAEASILEEVYTKLINLFSEFNPPHKTRVFPSKALGSCGIFQVVERLDIGGLEFEVLESLGGHVWGQVFFLCSQAGLLFTGDSLINFDSISEERKRFNTLANVLMTSVNVDSTKARREREALLAMASGMDKALSPGNCLICCGHGAVSVLHEDKFKVCGEVERYQPH